MIDTDLCGLRFVGLAELLREKLNKDVDVVGINHIEKGSRIEKEIADTGVVIYG